MHWLAYDAFEVVRVSLRAFKDLVYVKGVLVHSPEQVASLEFLNLEP
jgi:4-hydroxy-3-methylbut-2-enyl diphosphate reductase IspH